MVANSHLLGKNFRGDVTRMNHIAPVLDYRFSGNPLLIFIVMFSP